MKHPTNTGLVSETVPRFWRREVRALAEQGVQVTRDHLARAFVALAQEHPEHAALLELRAGGLSQAAIGARLGGGRSAVGHRLRRAREAFARHLQALLLSEVGR